jgi:hypothetical protein
MSSMTDQEILALPMQENDSGASTITGYFRALLTKLFEEEEGFSGKRPFGNSGWIYAVLCSKCTNDVTCAPTGDYPCHHPRCTNCLIPAR